MANVPTTGKPGVRADYPAYMAKSMVLRFDENVGDLQEEFLPFFHMESMTGMYDMELGSVGLGNPSLNTELELPRYDLPSQGRPVIYIAHKYALGVMMSFELQEDAQFGKVINSVMPELATSFKVERNEQAADIFNNAFTYQGYEPDLKALVAADHPSLKYANTRSNLLNLPLSIAGLQAAHVAGEKNVTESGKKRPIKLRHLIIGPSLAPLAMELTRSINRPGTTFDATPNDINTERGQWTVHVWHYLEDDGRWFALSDKEFHKLKWKDRKKLYRKTIIDDEVEAVKFLARARWAVGFSDWTGVYGYNPN
jgi:hypothetical protein